MWNREGDACGTERGMQNDAVWTSGYGFSHTRSMTSRAVQANAPSRVGAAGHTTYGDSVRRQHMATTTAHLCRRGFLCKCGVSMQFGEMKGGGTGRGNSAYLRETLTLPLNAH